MRQRTAPTGEAPPQKFAATRRFAEVKVAARKLVAIASGIESVQDGRIAASTS
jgi:hypothetical protein